MSFPAFLPSFATLALVSAMGCYRYVPLTGAPTVGTEVRASLNADGVAQLGPILGRGVTSVDGRVLSSEQDAWRIAIAQTRTADAPAVNWSGEPVSLPRAVVSNVQLRVLDRPRTLRAAVLAVLGGAAVGFAVKGLAGKSSGSDGTGGPPPP